VVYVAGVHYIPNISEYVVATLQIKTKTFEIQIQYIFSCFIIFFLKFFGRKTRNLLTKVG